MPTQFDVLALGEAMVEYNQLPDRPDHYLQGFGGDTSNTVIAASRQGARCGYLSAVGDDHFGLALLDLWQREGVACDGVYIAPQTPTGIYFVSHDAGGHRFHYRRSGSAASKMQPDTLPLELLTSTRWLHVSGISLAISESACETALAAMRAARAVGAQVSFDTNLRLALWPLAQARDRMMQALALADLALPSLDDVTLLFETDDPEILVDRIQALGPKLVVLKLGERGCLVAGPDGRRYMPPYPVKAVDASGAGDCFAGALLARLAHGDDPFQAAQYAGVAAALSTTGFGAVAPIPGTEDVRRALDAATHSEILAVTRSSSTPSI